MARYIADLWQITIDQRHAQDRKMARALLRIDWTRLRHPLGATTNRRRKRMPDWVVVSRKPIYTIKSLLAQWEKVRLVNFHNHSQRKNTGSFHRTTGVKRSSLAITTVIAPPATGILTTNIEQRSTKRQRGIREFTIDEGVTRKADEPTPPPPDTHPPPLPPPEPPPARRPTQLRLTALRQRPNQPRVRPQTHDDGKHGETAEATAACGPPPSEIELQASYCAEELTSSLQASSQPRGGSHIRQTTFPPLRNIFRGVRNPNPGVRTARLLF
jgi:hypothetical protein